MKKITVILGLLVIFLFAGVAQADFKESAVFAKEIANIQWKLNLEESRTKVTMPDLSMKFVPIKGKTIEEGELYSRESYIRGTKIRGKNHVRVEKLPKNEDNFLFALYEAKTYVPLEKIKMNDEGDLVLYGQGQMMLMNEIAFDQKGCIENEKEMECLRRLDPEAYVQRLLDERRADAERRRNAR